MPFRRREETQGEQENTYILLGYYCRSNMFIVLKVHAPRDVPLIGCQYLGSGRDKESNI